MRGRQVIPPAMASPLMLGRLRRGSVRCSWRGRLGVASAVLGRSRSGRVHGSWRGGAD